MSDTLYIEDAIHSHFTNDTGINGLVGGRVYPGRLPQVVILPAIMFRQISGPREKTHGETGAFVRARFEFNCYGRTFTEVAPLARLVRRLLTNHTGTMGVAPNEYQVDEIEISGPEDGWDDDINRHRRQLDAMLMYRED